MARYFNGGTDQVQWYDNALTLGLNNETVSFWMKTTQSTSTNALYSNWSSASRYGLGLILNSGKITFAGYSAFNLRIVMDSTSTVNNGSWQHIVAVADRVNGGLNSLYINGVLENSGNSSADWFANLRYYTCIGDNFDTFWNSYVGEFAEVAHWRNVKLTADQIAMLAKGFKPHRVCLTGLDLYAPLVRDVMSISQPTSIPPFGVYTITGTTITDHPRVYG